MVHSNQDSLLRFLFDELDYEKRNDAFVPKTYQSIYNLKKDPSEKNDLAKKHSDTAKELEDKLVAWQTEMKAKLPVPNPDYSPPAKKK